MQLVQRISALNTKATQAKDKAMASLDKVIKTALTPALVK